MEATSGQQWLDAELAGRPAALWEPGLTLLRARAGLVTGGGEDLEPANALAIHAAEGDAMAGGGGIAVLRIAGGIFPRANFMTRMLGWTALNELRATLRTLVAEPQISAVVLEFDSPGGLAEGLQETAGAMRAMRGAKPIVAMVNALAASAAYYLAAQADEVVTSPDGSLGSIGSVILHWEQSRALEMEGLRVNIIRSPERKYEGNMAEPLSEPARERFQTMVAEAAAQFEADVAKGRGIALGKVRSSFGQGSMLTAKEAVAVGMADRIDTLDGVLAKLSRPARGGARAESEALPLAAAPTIDTPAIDTAPLRRRLRMLELGA